MSWRPCSAHCPTCTFDWRRTGPFWSTARVGDERLALPPEQFLGRSLPDLLTSLMPPDVAVRIREAFAEVVRTGRLVCVEYPLRVNDCDCEFATRLFPLLEGSLIAVVRDITDRRRAERELRQREEHFRRLIETSHDLIQTLDAQGRIVYTGPSVTRLLGYTPEEITGGARPTTSTPTTIPRSRRRWCTRWRTRDR